MMRAVSSFVREHTRYPVELAVRMRCASWSDYLELYSGNLSRGGLFVGSAVSAPIGTEVAVELALPDGRALKMRAEVVHVTGADEARDLGRVAGMGVMFIDLEDETRQAIEAMVQVARAQGGKAPPPPVAPKPPPSPVAPKPPPPPMATRPPPIAQRQPPIAQQQPAIGQQAAAEAVAVAAPGARAPQFADVIEQALLDELARRMDLAPHAQLGLSLAANDADVEEAYTRLRERYAPAIFARYGESTAAVVRAINDALDGARRRLVDPSQRRALIVEAHQPKANEPNAVEAEQKRRGEEARQALRAGIERRVEEACAHRDLGRVDEAIRGFEAVLALDRKHDYARDELRKLRDKQHEPKHGLLDRLRKR